MIKFTTLNYERVYLPGMVLHRLFCLRPNQKYGWIRNGMRDFRVISTNFSADYVDDKMKVFRNTCRIGYKVYDKNV